PTLCAPTGHLPAPPAAERCGERTATMPLRTRTRAQNRAQRITTERHHNRQARLATQTAQTGPAPPDDDGEPPPF
ncbi:13E12 repeat family protein, partial [Mycobacterium nebraskense]